MQRFSKSTQADIEEIKAAWREFVRDLRTPWTFIPGIIAAIATALLFALPWLMVD